MHAMSVMTQCGGRTRFFASLAITLLAQFAGCAIRPMGEDDERARAEEAGRTLMEEAALPDLSGDPEPDVYLRYALLSNAELQSRYWEWRSAIEQVPQSSSFPNAAVPFSYMFSSENVKAWDRTTLGITNDPMTNIPFPSKVAAAGEIALEAARAAGLRFEAAKFQLQGRVLATYVDLALLGETIRIGAEGVALMRQIVAQTSARVQNGSAGQQELLRAQTDLDLAQNTLATQRAQAAGLIAKMNALLGRSPDAPVALPSAMPKPRLLSVEDAELIRLGSERSPELSALARDVAGRVRSVDLAQQGDLPDFSLSFNLLGTVTQTLGGMIILPTRLAAIQGAVDQARANLNAAELARRQYAYDLAASFVLNLAVLRNDERQITLFEGTVVPRSEQTVSIALTSYAANRTGFLEILDAQRTLLDARLTLSQVKAEREKALAAIETWSALDVETLTPGRMAVRGTMPTQRSGGPTGGRGGMSGPPPTGSAVMGR